MLKIHDESLISLAEEMKFLDTYIYLLKERFGSNLSVEIAIEEKYMDDLIAPVTLQYCLKAQSSTIP